MFQEFLDGAVDGFFGTDYLRDYKHASKVFRPNAYANSPKFKWLFHVYFDINKTLITQQPNIFPDDATPGLLVKNIQLPKFSMSLSEMNQYNRKRYVQTKLTYDPIQVTFHDDNAGAIRSMWYNYFSYYYSDPNSPIGATSSQASSILNKRNQYTPDISSDVNWGYRGEPSNTSTSSAIGIAKAPFFKSIKIYGFNQHSFALYELINPIIEKFDHDTYDYYQTTTMENRMTLRYETVKYQQGALNGQNPGAVVAGFGSEANYDRNLSPIARPGSNRTILGQGGLVDAGVGVLEDLQNGNILGAIQKGGTLFNTFKNPQSLFQTAKAELISGLFNATQNPQNARNLFNFPSTSSTTGSTSQSVSNQNFSDPNNLPLSVISNNPIGDSQGFIDQGQFL
jgi:hypothetical protein